ncbi:alpha-amylase family glycosyl hydrolase [Herbidospora yilanensis]|uniref:alpha-amylase family glycosyl hydrolase n=1 Tax=Herbidospora yilanensis TaxID=354426 RepID=UPI0007818F48|nr:alpha-amylase family glycosyl hydrolase [Herbidospora yilanensis]
MHPSPVTWRDQFLYFLLPDRFSDGREETRPMFDRTDAHRAPDPIGWAGSGSRFQGGTINGITGRLGYLRDLGVTTLWLGPVWRQRPGLETCHGYGGQDVMDVDPRFGSPDDLRSLVAEAHALGMYVLLDPGAEFRRGGFQTLKDLALTRDDVLSAVVDVYRHWIAFTDCDGFRIGTVRHVPWEVSRDVCGAIREYAESVGKENFLLLGEVTGGAGMARDHLDAVLDVGEPAALVAGLVKGFADPQAFFARYQGHDILGGHRETGRYRVTMFDDHDMVGRERRRFSAGNTGPHADAQVAHAVGVQLTTLGIPCVYYGTEQAFDGAAPAGGDGRYIRESMFGGTFGAFGTQGCHFFDPEHPAYRRIRALAAVRNRADGVGLALRRGRMYLREISTGGAFRLPATGELTAWSRILHDREVLVALNPTLDPLTALVTVHHPFHPEGSVLSVLYGETAPPSVVHHDGRALVRVSLPPAGMAILG